MTQKIKSMEKELVRIKFRQVLFLFPEGFEWLVANARSKEKDVGPHRPDAPIPLNERL